MARSANKEPSSGTRIVWIIFIRPFDFNNAWQSLLHHSASTLLPTRAIRQC
jgi:hypothetical protein